MRACVNQVALACASRALRSSCAGAAHPPPVSQPPPSSLDRWPGRAVTWTATGDESPPFRVAKLATCRPLELNGTFHDSASIMLPRRPRKNSSELRGLS